MESTSTSNNNSSGSSSSPSGEGTGIETGPVELTLAQLGDRFLAWLVDFILVAIGLAILYVLISIPFWFSHYGYYGNMERVFRDTGPLPYIVSSLGFLAYWTYFESTTGQSIGKKLLKIKTTDLGGGKIDIKSAIIESFGKAFLLPIDVALGWIFTNNKRQRVFNRITNTIVVKPKPKEIATAESIRYVKD